MRYQPKSLLVIATLATLLLALLLNWDAIPGTYCKDARGFPKGTGQVEYQYDNGALMLREWYYRGLIYRATWFTPEGREIATETYDKQKGGVGYFLRQDGSVRSKCNYKYVPEDNMYGTVGSPLFHEYERTACPRRHGID